MTSSHRYREIAARLRQQIVTGELAPGARLPTKLSLCGSFGVANATLQRTLDLLSAEGFLVSHGCRGTSVAAHPPHLVRIGVVYGATPERSRYLTAFQAETIRLAAAGHLQFTDYLNCSPGPHLLAVNPLRDDAAARRLAGILLPLPIPALAEVQLSQAGHPVCVTAGGAAWYPGAWHVAMQPMESRAFEFFREQGRRRLAIVCTPMQYGHREHWWAAAGRYGLQTARHWTFVCDYDHAFGLLPTLELLGRLPARLRPDALYLMDDHLVTVATEGVAAAGVRTGIGAPLLVLAHSNFPNVPPAACKVVRIGYDVRAIVAHAVAVVTARIAGQERPRLQVLQPVLESELPYALVP